MKDIVITLLILLFVIVMLCLECYWYGKVTGAKQAAEAIKQPSTEVHKRFMKDVVLRRLK